ncbi:testis-expressed protein 36 [Python bivittatus]|uniref:Testis-expressed protein 36 n=1 Tax=Python bivittatus TaxID=176946 RepID=A0A9F5MVS9_PYTBI|nr:testis-expressed protein 36 [Python bivittatus]
MPKGRRANPSTTRDGIWFKQSGNLQIYPESLTAAMQKQILNVDANCKIEKSLPLMYKVREKKPVNTFPFSIHDNRHSLVNVGEYLDSGLGLRKFQEKCQHYSQNYCFLAHEPIPSSNACRTIYQTSFVQYPDIKHSILGRFPKSHIDKSIALHSAPKNDYMWFSKCYTSSNNIAPTETTKSSFSEPEQLLSAEEEIK